MIASLFHQSAIYLLVFYWINYIIGIKSNKNFLIITVTICLGLYGLESTVIAFLKDTHYAFYFNTSYYWSYNRSIITVVSKAIYLPFFIHLFLMKPSFLSANDWWYIRFGTLCYFFKLISLFTFFYGRFSIYFDVLSYIPLYYYLYTLSKANYKSFRKAVMSIFIVVAFLPYLYKVLVWKKNEYNYNSILFCQVDIYNEKTTNISHLIFDAYDFRNCYFHNAQDKRAMS